MSNPRLRRLSLDYDRLLARFHQWRPIKISGVAGQPPEHYQVTYYIKGLYANAEGKILERHEHIAELNLSLDYPRRAPQCKLMTPIFHPNFDESSICIGDFWAASEGLDDLVVRIGRMITYQEYNTKSPLNGLAAKWAAEHARMLPVDPTELAPPSAAGSVEQSPKVVVNLGQAPPRAATLSPAARVVDIRTSAAEGSAAAAESRVPAPRLSFGAISVGLVGESTSVGRHADNLIQLNDSSVSGHHGLVQRSGSAFQIKDLGSTNGTRLNGSLIAEAPLKDGDLVSFGDVKAKFLIWQD